MTDMPCPLCALTKFQLFLISGTDWTKNGTLERPDPRSIGVGGGSTATLDSLLQVVDGDF